MISVLNSQKKKKNYINAMPCPGKEGEERAGLAVRSGWNRRSTHAGPDAHSHASAPFQPITVFNTKLFVR